MVDVALALFEGTTTEVEFLPVGRVEGLAAWLADGVARLCALVVGSTGVTEGRLT